MLARQAGETVKRPLSQAHLERALHVNYAASKGVMERVLAWASEQRKRGNIADHDIYFTE